MTNDPSTRSRASRTAFIGGLNGLETIVVAVIALVAMGGILMIAKGVYLKTASGPDEGKAETQITRQNETGADRTTTSSIPSPGPAASPAQASPPSAGTDTLAVTPAN